MSTPRNTVAVVKTAVVTAIFALVVGIAAIMGPAADAQTTGPYWFDRFSKCVDPCPSLDFPNCNCFQGPPIIVNG